MVLQRLTIRLETPADIPSIYLVNVKAFPTEDEARLVDRIREGGGMALSLVAEIEKRIVGHVLFSPVTVENPSDVQGALGLAPVTVLPEYQRQGIGVALIQLGLAGCAKSGANRVFLVGHPAYYPRLGFRPALPHGYTCPWMTPGEDHAHWMGIELVPGALKSGSGFVRFRPEFDEL